MEVRIEQSWRGVLEQEFKKSYFKDLTEYIRGEYLNHRIYPRAKDIFRAFDCCPYERVKVVIIGQDPYHGQGQANGLSFSVGAGVEPPPSLQNIFKEVSEDMGTEMARDGELERWAEQGVLLLNSVLTVRAAEAASHAGMGWERFTDAVVREIAGRKEGVVYMLWGRYAGRKGEFVDREKNCVLNSAHPSPLSAYRGFLGCKHFSMANKYLVDRGEKEIKW